MRLIIDHLQRDPSRLELLQDAHEALDEDTIGLPELTGFPEVVIFGLTPVAANGLLGLVVDMLQGGTEIPFGVELVGLLDNELRCIFTPVDLEQWCGFFGTATAWYRGRPFEMVQLLWPDRNGLLPTETGYAQHMRLAQPVIGTVDLAAD